MEVEIQTVHLVRHKADMASNWLIVLLFTFWSVEAFKWYTGDSGRVRWAYNCDFHGADIGTVKSMGEHCGRLCFQRPECKRFTWTHDEGGTCWFKSGDGNAFYPYSYSGSCGYVSVEKNILHSISWVIADLGRIRWSSNCDMTYGSNVEVRQTSGDECAVACRTRQDCIGFAWKSGSCRLKSYGFPFVDYTNSGGICGEIIGRTSSPPFYGSSDEHKRNSERACNDFTEIASHYQIIRGNLTQRNDFPWMAALYYPKDENESPSENNLEFHCAGTIISDYYILTAAHCLDDIEPVIARLGTHILNHSKKTDLKVESCTKHPNFVFETRESDIGVVKIGERITFNTKILPACLTNNRNDLPQNNELVVTGWGNDGENNVSNFLRKTIVRTVPLQTCKDDYLKRGSEPRYHIDNCHYCAIDPNNEHDASSCSSDCGGPLQVYESALATVVGVVSWGSACDGSYPGVFARVAYHLEWIEHVVWGND